jgi:hypothetical protein
MVTDILKTRLTSIDMECESASRPAIDRLYGQAQYDGSKFIVPSFQEASAVWVGLIAEKEQRFSAEIERVLGKPGMVLDSTGVNEIQEYLEALLSTEKYLERLERFSEGVARSASRYGITLDLTKYRFDLANAAYRTGVMNASRAALKSVVAELELNSTSAVPDAVRSFATWWHFIRAHPWKAVVSLIALCALPWLFSKIDLSVLWKPDLTP